MKIIIFILWLAFSIAAHAQSDTLVVGTQRFNPPYSVQNATNADLYGFDISIMQHICQILKVQCVFKAMSHADLLQKINTNELDMAIGSFPITREYLGNYIFSLPYLESNLVFMTDRISSFEMLKGIKNPKVGYIEGWIPPAFIKDNLGFDTQTLPYSNIISLLSALKTHAVDAIILDQHSAEYWVSESGNACKTVGQPIKYGLGYAILINPNYANQIPAINKAIITLEENGIFTQLYNAYIN